MPLIFFPFQSFVEIKFINRLYAELAFNALCGKKLNGDDLIVGFGFQKLDLLNQYEGIREIAHEKQLVKELKESTGLLQSKTCTEEKIKPVHNVEKTKEKILK